MRSKKTNFLFHKGPPPTLFGRSAVGASTVSRTRSLGDDEVWRLRCARQQQQLCDAINKKTRSPSLVQRRRETHGVHTTASDTDPHRAWEVSNNTKRTWPTRVTCRDVTDGLRDVDRAERTSRENGVRGDAGLGGVKC